MKTSLKKQFSRIKDIYVRVPDYHFSHSPSNPEKEDHRFIGRNRLIKRLTALLTKSQTTTGSYLITGYRGVGKSSLVNKVISDLRPRFVEPLTKMMVLRIWGIIFSLFLFHEVLVRAGSSNVPILGLHFAVLLLFLGTTGLILYSVIKKFGIKALTPTYRSESSSLSAHYLLIDTALALIYYSATLFILLIVNWLFYPENILIIRKGQPFASLLGMFLFMLFLTTRNSVKKNPLKKSGRKSRWKVFGHALKVLKNKIINRLKNKLNYSGLIPVNINLGHEDLKEYDILRVIAKQTKIKFKNSRGLFFGFPFGTGLYQTIAIYAFAYLTSYTFSDLKVLQGIFKIFKFIEGSINEFVKVDLKLVELIKPFTSIVHKTYDYVVSLFPISFLHNRLIPAELDLTFVTYMILLWLLVRFMSRYQLLGFQTHANVSYRLKVLNERIESEVSQDPGSRGGLLGLVGFRKKMYAKADVREIEVELIDIFERIHRLPNPFAKLNFIFIFDELDKIEINENSAVMDREQDDLSPVSNGKDSGKTNVRNRKELVAKILANLKHFFTTAKGKFIFIAGRELYDASLADVSDRNYFIGSIFNEVIYVNSFLTEGIDTDELDDSSDIQELREKPGHRSYYTSKTEEYLCQFIIPTNYEIKQARNLKTYYKFLKAHKDKDEFKLTDEEIFIIILKLDSFISYVHFRSSGAPKKLSSILESYIRQTDLSIKTEHHPEGNHAMVVNRHKYECLYLHFDVYDQYTFDFINYLTAPFIYNISRYVRTFGDKLMVSTTYLLDHLYKFHNFGFSWRNLEVTPEIIDVNKAPVLRDVIRDIISYLGYNHLRYLSNNLYDFRFSKKISLEINYITKISEKESAALNFTLDESLEIKRHYRRKLDELYSKHTKNAFFREPELIHSLSFLHGSLGDLHYYDQEYDDAIVEYKEASQYIRNLQFTSEKKSLPIDVLVVHIRLMLKMGLAMEKKDSYQSAYNTYQKLAELIIHSLDIDISKFGLKKEWDGTKTMVMGKSDTNEKQSGPDDSYPYSNVDSEKDYRYFPEQFKKQPLSPEAFGYLHKSSQTEVLRLLYQPFLAKLFIKIKEKNIGPTKKDFEEARKELAYLINLTDKSEELWLKAEFNHKAGNLEFYNYFYSPKIKAENALDYYKIAHRDFLEAGEKIPTIQFTLTQFEEIRAKNFFQAKSITENIVFMADVYLAQSTPENIKGCFQRFGNFSHLLSTEPHASVFEKGVCNFTNAILLYVFAHRLFTANGDHKKAAFQLVKVLSAIERAIKMDYFTDEVIKYDTWTEFTTNIESMVLNPAINSITKSYHSSTYPEIERIKSTFKIDSLMNHAEGDDLSSYILKSLPAYGEIMEARALFKSIVMKKPAATLEIPNVDLCVGRSHNLSNIYSLFHVLNLKSRYNHIQYDIIFNTRFTDHNNLTTLRKDLVIIQSLSTFTDKWFEKVEELYDKLDTIFTYKSDAVLPSYHFDINDSPVQASKLSQDILNDVNVHLISLRFQKSTLKKQSWLSKIESELQSIKGIPSKKLIQLLDDAHDKTIRATAMKSKLTICRSLLTNLSFLMKDKPSRIRLLEISKDFQALSTEPNASKLESLIRRINLNLKQLKSLTRTKQDLIVKDKIDEIESKWLPINSQIKLYLSNLAVEKFDCVDSDRKSAFNIFEYLLVDTIYCDTAIMRIFKTVGHSQIYNQSILASAYWRRAKMGRNFKEAILFRDQFIKLVEVLDKGYKGSDKNVDTKLKSVVKHLDNQGFKATNIYNDVREIIGAESILNLNPNFNLEKAKWHYEQCINEHNGGFTENKLGAAMYYLDDDFNDDYTHFHTALERFVINSDQVPNRIKDLEAEIAKSDETVISEAAFT